MAGYLGASPVPQTIQKKQSFTATASQTTFTTTGYTDGTVHQRVSQWGAVDKWYRLYSH